MPSPGFIPITVPAFVGAFTVTLPVPPLNVIFPPALAKSKPSLLISTLPAVFTTDIAVPAKTLSTELVEPPISTLTFRSAALAITFSLKSIEETLLVRSVVTPVSMSVKLTLT